MRSGVKSHDPPVFTPAGFFRRYRNQIGLRRFVIRGSRFIGGASMCDYSLHAVATRPAEVAETLVSTNFSTGTHGFASPDDPKVAVCLRPGTEIAFENEVQTDGMIKSVGDRLARFRQIALNKASQQHDALEFSNGAIVLVTDLTAGQRATVLQLPASPIEEKPQMPQPAARYDTANV